MLGGTRWSQVQKEIKMSINATFLLLSEDLFPS